MNTSTAQDVDPEVKSVSSIHTDCYDLSTGVVAVCYANYPYIHTRNYPLVTIRKRDPREPRICLQSVEAGLRHLGLLQSTVRLEGEQTLFQNQQIRIQSTCTIRKASMFPDKTAYVLAV